MIGDLRYFIKKLRKAQKKKFFEKFNVLSFKENETNIISKMSKCKLSITDSDITINNDVKYGFKDVTNIEMVDTVVHKSNKGLVIKIIFSDGFIFCFSLGSYHFLPGQFSTILITKEIYDLLNEKWHNNTGNFSDSTGDSSVN